MKKIFLSNFKARVAVLLAVLSLVSTATGCAQQPADTYINGSFTCEQLIFDTMVFDMHNENQFRYYSVSPDIGTQTVDIGTYTKISDNSFVINSKNFDNTEIEYNIEARSFSISINNVDYEFKHIGDPVVIEHASEI